MFCHREKDSLERQCRSLESRVSELSRDDSIERQMQRLQDESEANRNKREEMENAIQVRVSARQLLFVAYMDLDCRPNATLSTAGYSSGSAKCRK